MRPLASMRSMCLLSALAAAAACSSSPSGTSPAADAGSGVDAGSQPPPDGSLGASDAADGATDHCGAPATSSWSRCAANPVATAGFRQPDGRYELSVGDPDVQLDPVQNNQTAPSLIVLDVARRR
jgi:hypothetical protein